MSLVSCPECRAEVSDAALACPRCGYPDPGAEVEGQESERQPDLPSDAVEVSGRTLLVAAVVLGLLVLLVIGIISERGRESKSERDLHNSYCETFGEEDPDC